MAVEIKDNTIRDCYLALKRWLVNKSLGKNIGAVLELYGYKDVAIYGCDDICELIIDELKDTDIVVKYLIGKNGEANIFKNIPTIYWGEIPNQERVDVIIIPPTIDYASINLKLIEDGIEYPTIWIRDVMYEM